MARNKASARIPNLVERVKVALAILLINDPRLLQQVIRDVTADGVAFEVKVDVHVLSKTRWVIVSVGFRVSKSF